MAVPVACPRCKRPMDPATTTDHCVPKYGRCAWSRHSCGAVVHRAHPDLFLPPPSAPSKEPP